MTVLTDTICPECFHEMRVHIEVPNVFVGPQHDVPIRECQEVWCDCVLDGREV